MGFFDVAQDVIDKGVAAADKGVAVAKSAVSSLAVEQQGFAKHFVRMCCDAYDRGWHEANGGNLSYVMSAEEVQACRSFFYDTPSSWVPLAIESPAMGGAYLLVTGSGRHFRNMSEVMPENCGIVEIDATGASWRVVWGLKDCLPTSELSLHLACLDQRKQSERPARVLYHAHPANVMALTALVPVNSKELTLVLWKGLAEGIIAFPQGVYYAGWFVPGTPELANACKEGLAQRDAVVAVNHGVFCAGDTFDQVFGVVHTMDKSAEVYLKARAANGGYDAFVNQISDEGLRAIAKRYHLDACEEFLG